MPRPHKNHKDAQQLNALAQLKCRDHPNSDRAALDIKQYRYLQETDDT